MFSEEELGELKQVLIWALTEGYSLSNELEAIIKKLPITQTDLVYLREIAGLKINIEDLNTTS